MIKKTISSIAAVALTVMLTVTLMPLSSGTASAKVLYLPDVTAEMSRADYWAQKVGDPDRVQATMDEIEELNQQIWKTSRETRDLAAWPEGQYDAVAYVKGLLKSVGEDTLDDEGNIKAYCDAHYCYSVYGAKYDPSGAKVDNWRDLYGPRIANCQDPTVDLDATESDMRDYKFAICTTRSTLLVLPTNDPMLDDPSDPDYDVNYLSIVRVNEPLVLRTMSADGKYYSAMSSGCAGWIKASDVAICQDKQEWLEAWDYPSERLLVVYDDKIYTEDSNFQPETANRKLPMGTCLQLASDEEIQGRISNRTAHNNHAVWMPVRRDDGTYEKKLALIGENRKVSEGYLPMTTRNVLKVMLNQLGDAYGWGGMMGTNDCSGYVRDVYKCFGIDMPRSSNRNNGVVQCWDLSGMSDEDKTAFIKTLPPGAQLSFSGHEMLYLGYEEDRLYVISSVSNLRIPGEETVTRVRGAVINTLDMQRRDKSTWLQNLNYAEIPYVNSGTTSPACPADLSTDGYCLMLDGDGATKTYGGGFYVNAAGTTVTPTVRVRFYDDENTWGTLSSCKYTLQYEKKTGDGSWEEYTGESFGIDAGGAATYRVSAFGEESLSYTGSTAPVEFQVIPIASDYHLSANECTYNGQPITPDVIVKDAAGGVIDPANYSVSYSNHVNAGTATAKVKFAESYYKQMTKDLEFTIKPKATEPAVTLSPTSFRYNGKVRTPAVTVKDGTDVLTRNTDYTLKYSSSPKKPGRYKVTITLKGNYTGSGSASFTINKLANTLKVSGRTVTVKHSAVKKKAQVLGVTKVIKFTSKGQGTKTYTKTSGNKKITISKKTGKVTVKKGLKKGTYKVKVSVKAAGNANYKASNPKSLTVTVKIK